ncbi:MAG: hypothetical protein HY323_15845 [Betaproteobacteria bacterium]|nr:hypothetical protein [Betaproteobacteria bacterium]
MAKTTSVFVPTASSERGNEQFRRTIDRLEGAVVGFIDNAKPNFDHLVDDLAELLVGKYGVGRVLKRRKRAASIPAPESMVSELADSCNLVITGSGD